VNYSVILLFVFNQSLKLLACIEMKKTSGNDSRREGEETQGREGEETQGERDRRNKERGRGDTRGER
jgi:hypothetical protein